MKTLKLAGSGSYPSFESGFGFLSEVKGLNQRETENYGEKNGRKPYIFFYKTIENL